jgi:predicted phage-related endonuclease
MGATLDGRVEATRAVFEAKFMLPWSFSEEAAAEKYMAQLHHNMWVVTSRTAVLSVITGGGKWVEITTHADPLYQHLVVTAERKFWRCVESGEPPSLSGVEPPNPRIQAVRIVDMSDSNSWAEFAGIFARTCTAYLEHEQAKADLKTLMPEDAKEATARTPARGCQRSLRASRCMKPIWRGSVGLEMSNTAMPADRLRGDFGKGQIRNAETLSRCTP